MQQVTVKQALGAAIARHQAGDFVEAENIYRQVLGQFPELPDALHLMGILANQTHRRDLAESLLRKAVEISPHQCVYHRDLGIVLLDEGKLSQAQGALEASLALDPNSAASHNLMGVAFKRQHRSREAIEHFKAAIALAPGFLDPLVHLGNLLLDAGHPADSVECFDKVARLMPDSVAAWVNLANVCIRVGKFAQAEEAAKKALAIDPNIPPALAAPGIALKSRGDYDGAIEAFEKVLRINPQFAEARNNLANIWKDMGMLDKAKIEYQRAIDLAPEMDIFLSNLLFLSQYDPASTLEHDKALRLLWSLRHAESLLVQAAPFPKTPPDKIRVGFVSPDFRTHSVGRFLLPLLKSLDRSRFFVACYSDSSIRDEITSQLMSYADLWVDTVTLSHEQLDQRVRADDIHILIDLAAHTAGNRLLAFARKPAPVQITWLGYCGSTGLKTMDYRLSDPHMDPPGMFEDYFTENTLRLPSTYWCYPAPDLKIEPTPSPCVSKGHVAFGCLNYFGKVSPQAMNCWIDILKRVPDSRLIVLAGEGACRTRLLEACAVSGIDPQRLGFVTQKPLDEFLRAYEQIDIALDSFPFNGGMTTCDALWMGVPVVTLEGDRPVGRAGASILKNLNLSELVASNASQYIDLAVELAGDVVRLTELRKTLRGRMLSSPLMDGAGFGKDFSNLLEKAWNEKRGL